MTTQGTACYMLLSTIAFLIVMTLINRTPTSVLYRYNVGVAVHAGNYYNKKVYTCSMVPNVQSIREYQNVPNSYMLFTKVSMRLCINHSLCSAVHNYDSLCRRSSRSPIMLSILLVYIHISSTCTIQSIMMFHLTHLREPYRYYYTSGLCM